MYICICIYRERERDRYTDTYTYTYTYTYTWRERKRERERDCHSPEAVEGAKARGSCASAGPIGYGAMVVFQMSVHLASV